MEQHLTTHFVDSSTDTEFLQRLVKLHGVPTRRFITLRSFCDAVDQETPGCVVINGQSVKEEAQSFIRTLRIENSPLSTIVYDDSADVSNAVRWMEAGALTVLRGERPANELVSAISRGSTLSHQRWTTIHKRASVQQRLETLSVEESDVLELLLNGKSNKQITQALILSDRTVARRRRNIMDKVGVESLVELCRVVFSTGHPLAMPREIGDFDRIDNS